MSTQRNSTRNKQPPSVLELASHEDSADDAPVVRVRHERASHESHRASRPASRDVHPGSDSSENEGGSSDCDTNGGASDCELPRSRIQKATPTSHRRIQSSSDDDSDHTSLPVSPTARSTTRTKGRRSSAPSNRAIQSDSDDSERPTAPTVRSVPRRTQPVRTVAKSQPKPKQRRRSMLSDEEYVDDASKDESDESEVNDSNDSEIDENFTARSTQRASLTPKRVGIVQEGDIGSAEEDSDESHPIVVRSPPLNVQPIVRTSGSTRQGMSSAFYDSDSSSQDGPANSASSQRHYRSPTAVCLECPSRHDVVTADDLPSMHVCFFPPDGPRQCFALDTLRRIALSVPQPRLRTDATGKQAVTFLQPPHFRTAMSDDLLDQIASRFGLDALDIHGPYYTTRGGPPKVADTAWPTVPSLQSTTSVVSHSETFIQQLERYIRSRMGSQDLYCCPVCYIAAHQQLTTALQDDDSDTEPHDESIDVRYPTEFAHDPMTVLGYADNDSFRVASTFCFTKVAALKHHLRRDHGLDTKKVKGNDVYVRYKIRAQDGLLQRFLTRNAGRWGPTRQGEMLSYWFHGHNASFVLLLSLVAHAALCRDIVTQDHHNDNDAVATAEEYLLGASEFQESFADDALAMWDMVTAPFTGSNEDIRDFVMDDDDESVEGDGGDNQMMHRAMDMKADLEDLRSARQEADDYAARYETFRDDSDEEASNDDVAHGGTVYESLSDEEDDWEQSIRNKRVARERFSGQKRRRSHQRDKALGTTTLPHKPGTGKASSPLTLSSDEEIAVVVPKSRRHLAILDSDDDK